MVSKLSIVEGARSLIQISTQNTWLALPERSSLGFSTGGRKNRDVHSVKTRAGSVTRSFRSQPRPSRLSPLGRLKGMRILCAPIRSWCRWIEGMVDGPANWVSESQCRGPWLEEQQQPTRFSTTCLGSDHPPGEIAVMRCRLIRPPISRSAWVSGSWKLGRVGREKIYCWEDWLWMPVVWLDKIDYGFLLLDWIRLIMDLYWLFVRIIYSTNV